MADVETFTSEPGPGYIMRAVRTHGATFLVILIAACFAVQILGPIRIWPTSIHWLMHGDQGNHYLGWLFFRQESWSFPFGRIQGLLYPHGTNISLTDSIPFMALALKPFSKWLPIDFQFLGPWLFLNYLLQAFVGFKLVQCLGARGLSAILGSLLFLLYPPFLRLHGSIALSTHWLLLAMPVLFFSRSRFLPAWLIAINLLALYTHPYLWAMVFLFSLVHYWATRRVLGLAGVVTHLAILLTLLGIGLFLLLGRPDISTLTTIGMGQAPADLTALFNPRFPGSLVPPWPMPPNPWEGYGYLGLGGLFLLVAAGCVGVGRHRQRRALFRAIERYWFAFIFFPIACFFYALSSRIHFAGTEILQIDWLWSYIEQPSGAFRATGRFIWPFGYAILGWSIFTITLSKKCAPGILAVALGLQITDRYFLGFAPKLWPFEAVATQSALEKYTSAAHELRLIPPLVNSSGFNCGPIQDPLDFARDRDIYFRWALFAGQRGLKSASGITSRATKAILENCQVSASREPGVLYIFTSGHSHRLADGNGGSKIRVSENCTLVGRGRDWACLGVAGERLVDMRLRKKSVTTERSVSGKL